MKKMVFVVLLLQYSIAVLCAQPTFKAGFKTYATAMVIHEYTYNYVHTDSARITLADSTLVYVAADSMVTMSEYYSNREKAMYKTVNYFNPKKLLLKTESYKDENLLETNEWVYDDKNRKTAHLRSNKINNNLYRKSYDYNTDKKTGEWVVTESSYFNNKIEFYTKSYYNSDHEKYKEVRLNDNNKDIIHIETYAYGENGKVKERSVYFPEFKVTKKFEEPAGCVPAKCFCIKPTGTMEKVNPATKAPFIKRVILKNMAILTDPACKEYEYTFTNNTNCAITISSTKGNNTKKVCYRFKERI